MKDYKAKLVPGGVYHVYNRAIGDELLFRKEENYLYFLKKYQEYITPVASTLSYCLMPNHFHFLIQIRSEAEIFCNRDQRVIHKWLFNTSYKVYEQYMNRTISLQFSHLFNGYSQAYNKMYDRKGSLFIRSFNRRKVESDKQLINTIIYIHTNPVKDGFIELPEKWMYSSYNEIINNRPYMTDLIYVMDLFENVENFSSIVKQTLTGL